MAVYLIEEGFNLMVNGDLEGAKNAFLGVIETDSRNEKAYYGIGYIHFANNELQDAYDCMMKAIEIKQNYAEAHNILGLIFQRAGYWAEAEKSHRTAIQLIPSFSNAHVALGQLLKNVGRIKEAETCYRNAIIADSEDAEAYDGLGNLLVQQQKNQEAEACYKKAISLEPNRAGFYSNLGAYYDLQSMYELARENFEKAIAVDPYYGPGYSNLAIYWKRKGESEKAITLFRKGIELEPEFTDSYHRLGRILRDEGLWEEAEHIQLKAIEINPADPEAYFNLGVLYHKKGLEKKAEELYRKSIEMDPDFAQAYTNLGYIIQIADPIEAERLYRKAIELLPDDHIPYLNLGIVLKDLQEYEEGEKYFQASITLCPTDKKIFYNLGELYRMSGRLSEAITAFSKAVEIDPGYGLALNGLGEIYLELNSFEKATSSFKRAIAANSDVAGACFGLGGVHFKMEDMVGAYDYFMQSISHNSERSAPYLNLSQIQYEINPHRQQHFFRAVYIAKRMRQMKSLASALRRSFSFEVPMLVRRIISFLPLAEFVRSFSTDENENYEVCLRQTEELEKLFKLWRMQYQVSSAQLHAEAIVNYYLGDPIEAYDIFDKKMDFHQMEWTLCGRYYFCLASSDIMEIQDTTLKNSINHADNILAGNAPIEDSERYYAALIYQLAEDYSKAENILQELFPRFLPAGYKLAEQYQYLKADKDKHEKIVREIRFAETTKPTYLFGIERILPPHDPGEFWQEIQPLVHFAEIQPVISYILAKPLELRSLFYNGIQLRGDNYKRESLSLKEKSAKAWMEMLTREVDENELADLTRGFSQFQQPAHRIGEFIQNGAKAELFDIKERHRQKTQFNFKLYLKLNYLLFKENKITFPEALTINDYIYSCMDALPVFKDNIAMNYLLDCVKEYFIEDTIPYVKYVLQLHTLIQLIRKQYKGEKGKILSYKEFQEIHKQLT